MEFVYVYILQSQSDPEHFYTGLTDDLRDRLRRHNAGEVPHTSSRFLVVGSKPCSKTVELWPPSGVIFHQALL
jgi:hypothetical protein